MKLFIVIPMILSFSLTSLSCKEEHNKSSDSQGESWLMYVGTYTKKEAHVDGKAKGIYIYKIDSVTGALTFVSTSPFTTNPSYLTVNKGCTRLYCVNEIADSSASGGQVSAFEITDQGRNLNILNSSASEGSYPCYIHLTADESKVMVANYGSGNVTVLPIGENGSLGKSVSSHFHKGKGNTPRQESPHAHCILTSEKHPLAFSCDLGTDEVIIYSFNKTTGLLNPLGKNYETHKGSGPRHMIFHPYLPVAYIINELNGTIECIQSDTSGNQWERFQVIPTIERSEIQAASADIHITSNGKFLYATNRGTLNNIAMYSVNEQTGELTYLGAVSSKGRTPRNFVIDPNDNFVFVANQDSDNVYTFRIDKQSGKLVDTGIETRIPTPVCLKIARVKSIIRTNQ